MWALLDWLDDTVAHHLEWAPYPLFCWWNSHVCYGIAIHRLDAGRSR